MTHTRLGWHHRNRDVNLIQTDVIWHQAHVCGIEEIARRHRIERTLWRGVEDVGEIRSAERKDSESESIHDNRLSNLSRARIAHQRSVRMRDDRVAAGAGKNRTDSAKYCIAGVQQVWYPVHPNHIIRTGHSICLHVKNKFLRESLKEPIMVQYGNRIRRYLHRDRGIGDN